MVDPSAVWAVSRWSSLPNVAWIRKFWSYSGFCKFQNGGRRPSWFTNFEILRPQTGCRAGGTNTENTENKRRCVIGAISRRILNTLGPHKAKPALDFFYFRFTLVFSISTAGYRLLCQCQPLGVGQSFPIITFQQLDRSVLCIFVGVNHYYQSCNIWIYR